MKINFKEEKMASFKESFKKIEGID